VSDINENDFSPLEPQPFVTEEGREVERLRAALADMRQQRQELQLLAAAEGANTASLLHTLALIREAGKWQKEMLSELPGAVKAMREQRDEAHSLICAWWRKNAVDIVDDGESMYALTPTGNRAMMNDADKRAFLAATTEWRGETDGK
jgi:hypothetical protein